MPELPDVAVYVERMRALFGKHVLVKIRFANPFILRTVEPAPAQVEGKRLGTVERIGKRLVLGFAQNHFLVFHLMIAGRLRLREAGAPIPRKLGHLALDFDNGTLVLTEAGTKKRASLHIVKGKKALAQFDRGGLEPIGSDVAEFTARLRSENRTVKRALVDPRLLSGIGNAYSDEILHAAKLAPTKRTGQMSDEEYQRLHAATQHVLIQWVQRLRAEVGDGFPEKVTAFRDEMAVHGRFRKPCPVCAAPVQRIVYASNECNYCPRCQTGGKLLADRALSRLLKGDWPRSLEELEELEERKVRT